MSIDRFSRPPSFCRSCLAWGHMSVAGWCQACYLFSFDHDADRCAGCGRSEPLRNDYCRLCWHQAREDGLASGATGSAATASHFLGQQDGHHQLFFAT